MSENIIPSLLFGQNLEHTRRAIHGGLSAQLIYNRKFAGLPQPNGLARFWEPVGERPDFELLYPFEVPEEEFFTRHAQAAMRDRPNERNTQYIQNLEPSGTAGLKQGGLPLRGGVDYTLRVVVRALNHDVFPVNVKIKGVFASDFTLAGGDYRTFEFVFHSPADIDTELQISFQGPYAMAVGAVSLMPNDNFHGMRRDVIDLLKSLGTKTIRWPGGNFAGDYRWRDGLLPVDQRTPLQAFRQMETLPDTFGFEDNDLCTDDIILLCREIGAMPIFCLNLYWDTPQDSADWVEYCNGAPDTEYGRLRAERGFPEPFNVTWWCLGNELGHSHMEGPRLPAEYVPLARAHADAVLKVTPDLTLLTCGPFPSEWWARESAEMLKDVAPMISLHYYMFPCHEDFTTPERARETVSRVLKLSDNLFDTVRKTREMLSDDIKISLDEWNLWYAWFRRQTPMAGVLIQKIMHQLMRTWEQYGVVNASYYQAVNEGAIEVTPRGVKLTSYGLGMKLASRHACGKPFTWEDQPQQLFVTEHGSGEFHVSLYNDSPDEEMTFEVMIPGLDRRRIESAELYCAPGGDCRPGTEMVKETLGNRLTAAGQTVEIILPPCSVAGFRVCQ